jgi:hypothetical protein
MILTCDDCQKQHSGSSDQCLVCPQFQWLFIDAENTPDTDNRFAATNYRVLQVIGISIAGAGAIAAILELPVIGSGMVFFGFGLWFADILSAS